MEDAPEPLPGSTCMAPLGDRANPLGETCRKPAVTQRAVEGIWFPLCAEHAQAVDEEPASGPY